MTVEEQIQIRLAENAAIDARSWRNEELTRTDFIVPTTDHPQHAAYITYRVALRSWPSDSENFPDTRPELGE